MYIHYTIYLPIYIKLLSAGIFTIFKYWPLLQTFQRYVIHYLLLNTQNEKLSLYIASRSVTYRYGDFQLKLYIDALRWLRGAFRRKSNISQCCQKETLTTEIMYYSCVLCDVYCIFSSLFSISMYITFCLIWNQVNR